MEIKYTTCIKGNGFGIIRCTPYRNLKEVYVNSHLKGEFPTEKDAEDKIKKLEALDKKEAGCYDTGQGEKMRITILDKDFGEVRGYCLPPLSVRVGELDLEQLIMDEVKDYSEGYYPLGSVTITKDEEIAHCYNFSVAVISEVEFRTECAEHAADMAQDR